MSTNVVLTLYSYAGTTDLTLFLKKETTPATIANTGGDALTAGAEGTFTATVAESLSGVYDVVVKQGSTVVAAGGKVVFDGSGTVYVDAMSRSIPETPQRDVTDTRPLEFDWPIIGATFANSASTCTRRFAGETGSQAEALSGAITAVSGVSGRYKLAYNINDRAADGTVVIPTEVTYTLVDDSGNVGYLTLRIITLEVTGGIAVLPGRDRAVADAGESTITVKLGEIITIARAVVDANGQPMDLSGFSNLQFVVQDARGVDLATVAHADITISGADDDTYSFVTPSGMTAKLGVFDFSLNQVGGGQIVGGKWIVLRRAVAD
jgi:hypothetical protein